MSTPRDQRGSALMQVMVVAAVVSVITLALNAVITNAVKDTQGLEQKLEIVQAQQDFLRELADPGLCACNFDRNINTLNSTPLTYDSTDPNSKISMDKLYSRCVGGVPSAVMAERGQKLPGNTSKVTVSAIELKNIEDVGTGRIRATLEITFDATKLNLARKPASVLLSITADTTTPTQARITGCSSSMSVGPGFSGGGSFTCAGVDRDASNNTLPEGPAGAVLYPVPGPAGVNQYGGRIFRIESMSAPTCTNSAPTLQYHQCTVAGQSTGGGVPGPFDPTFVWKYFYVVCDPLSG